MKIKLTEADVRAAEPRAAAFDILDNVVDGLLARVQPTGHKAYFIRYKTPDGRRTRTKIGNCSAISLKDARAAAKIELGKIAKGVDINAERRAKEATRRKEKSAITFRAFSEGAYHDWAKINLKSYVTTMHRLQNSFSALYNRKLSDITPWNVEQWRARRLKQGITRSTVNRDLASLRAMLSRAVEWGVLSEHPLPGFKLLKVDDSKPPRFLSPTEEKRLREALTSAPAYLQTLVVIALNTGCRRGELLHLTWGAIKANQLTVHGAGAKSGKTRIIPLNVEAQNALSEWRKDQSHTDPGDWVFPGQRGNPLRDPKRAWSVLRDEAKLEGFRFHDLRHSFASKLVMAGVDLNTVRELLGHADYKMTLRYSHLAPEHKIDAVGRLCV
jgi:integrase